MAVACGHQLIKNCHRGLSFIMLTCWAVSQKGPKLQKIHNENIPVLWWIFHIFFTTSLAVSLLGGLISPYPNRLKKKHSWILLFSANRVHSISAVFWNVHCPGPYVFMTSVMLFVPDSNTDYHSCWDKDARYLISIFFYFRTKSITQYWRICLIQSKNSMKM